jgi:hypothetical protein
MPPVLMKGLKFHELPPPEDREMLEAVMRLCAGRWMLQVIHRERHR